MATSAQMDAAALVELLESADLKTVSDTQCLITENLQKGREAWLVNALVDSYMASKSSKVAEILSNMQEPNEKYLLDRLCDHMKGNSKLNSLDLLAQIVRRHPPWLHKTAKHPLFFPILIKIMKMETDVPILMMGMLAIAMLLPAIPVLIKPYLEDVFDIYCRIASLCYSKPAGIPDLHIRHLHAGLYCFFHRIYGMYPCNFLHCMRVIYHRPEEWKVFQEIVKPMLEKVRMHPLLIQTSKDKEVKPERWRAKEIHDIVVECSAVSLDLNEGCSEERSEMPLSLKSGQIQAALGDLDVMSPKQFTAAASQRSVKVQPLKILGGKPLVVTEKTDAHWSPSVVCGLSSVPSGGASAEAPSDPAAGHLPVSENTPLSSITPNMSSVTPNIMTDSPYPPSSTEKIPTPYDDKFMETPDQRPRPVLQTQLSQISETSDGLTSRVAADSATEQAVTRSQAVRKISFEETEGCDEDESVKEADLQRSGESGTLPSVPSVKELSRILDRLDVSDGAPEVDEEVSELTGDGGASTDSEGEAHPSHLPASLEMTAASVKEFMQKVNRIKFNSMTAQRVSKTTKTSERSESCPDLVETEAQADEGRDADQMSVATKMRPSTNAPGSQTLRVTTTTTTEMCASSGNSPDTISRRSFNLLIDELKRDTLTVYPYMEFIPEVVPFFSGKRSQTDDEKSDDVKSVKPLFTQYTPTDLLDKYIQQGIGLHESELTQTPLPNTGTVPADEITILKGQISLLHSQLLYERSRRQVYAQRNRRLLKHIAKSKALEEQALAQSDQLRLQETEMQNLRSALAKQESENKALREIREAFESEFVANKRSAKQDLENLQKQNEDLKRSLTKEKENNESATKELQSSKANLFSLKIEFDNLKIKASKSEELHRLVLQLNKELLQSGELHQTYQKRLGEVMRSHQAQAQTALLADALNAELVGVRLKAEERLTASEMAKAKLVEAEEALKNKDMLLREQKKLLAEQRLMYSNHMDVLEEKSRSQKAVQQALQGQILELHNRLSQLQPPVVGEISAPSSDEAVRRHLLPQSPSRTSMSSAELADEAVSIDASGAPSPSQGFSPSRSSAFQSYQRSPGAQSPEQS